MSYRLQCNVNSNERKRYITNLKIDNYKNKLHYTINNAGLNGFNLLSSCLYTNTNNA